MRSVLPGLALAWSLFAGLPAGCKRPEEASAPSKAAAAVAPAKRLAELDEEEKLLAARGDLIINRKRLSERREALLKQRSEATNADPAALEKLQNEDKKLIAEEQDLNRREKEILAKLEALSKRDEERRSQATAASDPAASLARREAALARREAELARREADLTRREREHLAARSKALDECRNLPVQTVTRVEVPRGASYSRRDVDPLLRQVHQQMRARGILETDLPTAQPLFATISRATRTGDYTRAKFAAEQLLELVKSTRIDRSFIGAKIDRLSARMRGRSLNGALRGQVDALFRKATAHYGDGQFQASNVELNRIYALLR